MSSPRNGQERTGQERTGPKAWLHELGSSRRTQVALAAFVLVLAYLLWPAAPTPQPRAQAPGRLASVPRDARQIESLHKLKDLTRLDQTGELPSEGRMYRDLFVFDEPAPPPPPPKPVKRLPPPPPPTPAEIAAAKLAQARQEAINSRPQVLHYLGYMGRSSTGRIASFSRGDEIVSLRVGDLASPGWKLIAITDIYAEFQHLTFQDIRFRSEAKDRQAPSAPSTTNAF